MVEYGTMSEMQKKMSPKIKLIDFYCNNRNSAENRATFLFIQQNIKQNTSSSNSNLIKKSK